MKKILLLIVVAAAMFALCRPAKAQQRRDRIVIYTTTGEKYSGTLKNETEKLVTMDIDGGTVAIPVSIIDRRVGLRKEGSFRVIMVDEKKLARRLHKELELGRDFGELVEKYSLHISALDGGMTGWVGKEYFPQEVANSIFDLRENSSSFPIEVGDRGQYYIVKLLEKKEVEQGPESPPEETAPEETTETPEKEEGQGDDAEKPVDNETRIGVLTLAETTREARSGYLGEDIRELLVSMLDETTGLDAFAYGEEPETADKPRFVISGEVGRRGVVYAVQFTLLDDKGEELLKTRRLTAVCVDSMDDLVEAVRQLSEVLVEKMR